MYERYLLKRSLKLIYERYVYSTFRPRNVEYLRNVDYTVRFRPILRFVAHIYVHSFSAHLGVGDLLDEFYPFNFLVRIISVWIIVISG